MQYSTSSNPIIYPLLPKIIDTGNVETYFAVCRQDIEWVQSLTYTGDTRVALLSLLAGFQSLGYFPELSRLSSQVVKHIAHALEVDAPLSLQLNNRTLYRYHQHIRRHLGISPWNKKDQATGMGHDGKNGCDPIQLDGFDQCNNRNTDPIQYRAPCPVHGELQIMT